MISFRVAFAGAIVVTLAGAAGAVSAGADQGGSVTDLENSALMPSGSPDSDVHQKSGVTSDGRTFGVAPDSGLVGEMPDLVAVVGERGRSGYVDAGALFGPDDRDLTPEQIERQQEALPPIIVLDVYAEDGRTVIDTFEMKTGTFSGGDVLINPEFE